MTAIQPEPVPFHKPDLRPAADAVATRREVEPPLPVGVAPAPIGPPSATVVAEVGRSLLAAEALATGGGEGDGERRLKPWGVAMLPHEARGGAGGDAPRGG